MLLSYCFLRFSHLHLSPLLLCLEKNLTSHVCCFPFCRSCNSGFYIGQFWFLHPSFCDVWWPYGSAGYNWNDGSVLIWYEYKYYIAFFWAKQFSLETIAQLWCMQHFISLPIYSKSTSICFNIYDNHIAVLTLQVIIFKDLSPGMIFWIILKVGTYYRRNTVAAFLTTTIRF